MKRFDSFQGRSIFMTKVKARDIIPGWPKPRSTSHMFPRWTWWFWEWYVGPLKAEEFRLTKEYHENQQRMQDTYFERWRTPQSKPVMVVRNPMDGVLGKCAGFDYDEERTITDVTQLPKA